MSQKNQPHINTQAHVATPLPLPGQLAQALQIAAEQTLAQQGEVEDDLPATSDDEVFNPEEFSDVPTTEPTSDAESSDLWAGDPDVDENEDDDALLEIYHSKCLRCSSLVSFATEKFKKCHFTKGNEHCPAQSVKITIRIPVEMVVRKFIVALKTGDNQKLAKLYSHLAEKELWYQERINTALKKARQEEGV